MDPYNLLATMLCRLYKDSNPSLFELSWAPLTVSIVEQGAIFNWVEILSRNVIKAIRETREAPQKRLVNFFFYVCLFIGCSLCL